MTAPNIARLYQLLYGKAQEITDEQGHWHQREFTEVVHQLITSPALEPSVRAAIDFLAARSLSRGFTERRNPRRRNNSSFYHPDDILKLGNGERTWMKNATPTDLPQWLLEDSKNANRIANASAEKQSYGRDRLASFRRYPDYPTLGDLEPAVYGYEPEPEAGPEPDEPES